MSDRIKVRFLRPFRVYRRGDVIEMDAGPARSWMAAGIVGLVGEEQQLLEVAMVENRATETADAPRRRGRKSR